MNPSFLHRIRWTNVALVAAAVTAVALLMTWPSSDPPPAGEPPRVARPAVPEAAPLDPPPSALRRARRRPSRAVASRVPVSRSRSRRRARPQPPRRPAAAPPSPAAPAARPAPPASSVTAAPAAPPPGEFGFER